MIGKLVKQVNNLRVTKDEKQQVYHVYNPDGVEVYSHAYLGIALRWCYACTAYLKKSNTKGKFTEEI